VAGQLSENISIDWRLAHFAETQNLRLCNVPFRFFSGGNVALNRKWLDRVGGFDEAFNAWGGEDIEFAYRLYRAGCFFRAVDGGLAYHQEPPGKENETDREEGKRITQPLVRSKVHFSYRRPLPGAPEDTTQNPLVSIYIPAYNCEEFIEKCVESALSQSITDLEVCVCDDGSTDNTWAILQQHYGSHPRVNIMRKDNGGIGSASNAAVRMCRGHYIGQLDADDFLECDAVEACLNEFLADFNLACVYTTYRNVDTQGKLIADGYNWPEFSREKFTTAMIVHHFRMFTARAWNLTEGFHEHIINAVDYDMYLKLSEVGPFKHVNRICYNRTLHGENTSVRKIREQKKNHFRVVNESLERQGIEDWRIVPADPGDDASRTLLFAPRSGTAGVLGASG
jgi:chondroitin synthase